MSDIYQRSLDEFAATTPYSAYQIAEKIYPFISNGVTAYALADAVDEEKLATALRATGRWKVVRRPTWRERIRGLLRRERITTVDITPDTSGFVRAVREGRLHHD